MGLIDRFVSGSFDPRARLLFDRPPAQERPFLDTCGERDKSNTVLPRRYAGHASKSRRSSPKRAGVPTMDVAAWLRSLGLSRYEAAFGKNAIDVDVLPDLTDGDLAELGVNLGDRKRLLKAIAEAGLRRTAQAGAPRPSLRQKTTPNVGQSLSYSAILSVRPRSRPSSTRGLAQPRRVISRRSVGGGDEAWRPCARTRSATG